MSEPEKKSNTTRNVIIIIIVIIVILIIIGLVVWLLTRSNDSTGTGGGAIVCKSDADCPIGFCNVNTGVCKLCLTNDNCTDSINPICLPEGLCGGCAVSADCKTGRMCLNHKCTCLGDIDCPTGEKCMNTQCVADTTNTT